MWTGDIQEIIEQNGSLSPEELADQIAKSLEKRENLLKISAMNLYEIEDNSSVECLQQFKIAFRSALNAMCECIDKFMPEKAVEKKSLIQYGLFPFTYGIYPYTHPTEKQKMAMDAVGIEYKSISVYEMSYRFLLQLFR